MGCGERRKEGEGEKGRDAQKSHDFCLYNDVIKTHFAVNFPPPLLLVCRLLLAV